MTSERFSGALTEYKFILHGLELEFPKTLSIAEKAGGTPEKLKAHRYLYDHIYYDAAHHAKRSILGIRALPGRYGYDGAPSYLVLLMLQSALCD